MNDNTTNQPIFDLVKLLKNTAQTATKDADISNEDLRKTLTFISRVIEVVQICCVELLSQLIKVKYLTVEVVRSNAFFDLILYFDGFAHESKFYRAQDICGRLEQIHASKEHLISRVVSRNIESIDAWLYRWLEVFGTIRISRAETINKVRLSCQEVVRELENLKYNLDESNIESNVKKVNFKATEYINSIDKSLRELIRLNHKIAGESGEIGFLELIEDRSSLREKAEIFFTNIEDRSVSQTFNNDLREAKVANFANSIQDNARQQSIQHNYPSDQKQTLAEAAEEIQNLLKVLEKTNPAATQADKQAFVTAAIAPPTKERIVKALQAGGEKALEEFLKNPYVNVVAAIVKEWQKAQ